MTAFPTCIIIPFGYIGVQKPHIVLRAVASNFSVQQVRVRAPGWRNLSKFHGAFVAGSRPQLLPPPPEAEAEAASQQRQRGDTACTGRMPDIG